MKTIQIMVLGEREWESVQRLREEAVRGRLRVSQICAEVGVGECGFEEKPLWKGQLFVYYAAA